MPSDPRQAGLFETREDIDLAPGARLLAGFASRDAAALIEAIGAIAAGAPFRHLTVPGGKTMSVAMTNSGAAGWVSDRRGYRYEPHDPLSGEPWPAMPPLFLDLAARAAAAGGFDGFVPDGCLINRYEPGARMGLHQDRDETDLAAPIVSLSLGLPGVFLWGGVERGGKPRRLPLLHGDIVVWGGPSRLTFHGVDPVKPGEHPLTGAARYNLTFRKTV